MYDKERQDKLENYLLHEAQKLQGSASNKLDESLQKKVISNKPVKSKCLEIITYPNAKWVIKAGKIKRVTFETKTFIDFDSSTSVFYSDLNKVMDIGEDPNVADHNVYLKLNLRDSSVNIPFNEIKDALTVYEYIKKILVGKGNNYVSIKESEVSGKTIPATNKKNIS